MRYWIVIVTLLLSTSSSFGASTINGLPPIAFPLTDSGCPPGSTENLWITQGSGDFRVTPEQLGYAFQGPIPPVCPYRYQFWWNTSITPTQYQVYDGGNWLVVGALDIINHAWTLPSPILSGTVSGTYTLGGTVSITSPSISNPHISGSITGNYTLTPTATIVSPIISNPTITGTIIGNNILPLAGLAQISAHTVLGNATGSAANVTNAYSVSGTDTNILASTKGTFIAGDITVSADTNGTVQAGTNYGSSIFYRNSNSGGAINLVVLNSNSSTNTSANLTLQGGTANAVFNATLIDDPSAGSRLAKLITGSAIGGGIVIDASPGGSGAVLALKSGAGGIALQGSPEVLESNVNSGGVTDFRVFNNSSNANTIAALIAQTGTGGATITTEMIDGGTPVGTIVTGAGALGGLTLHTSAGPISLTPVTASVPQVFVSNTNAGGETRFQVLNSSSVGNTISSLFAVTGTANANAFLRIIDGATPIANVGSSQGATGGMVLVSGAGPVTIAPAATVSLTGTPQLVVAFNAPGASGWMQVLNNSTAGTTVSQIDIATGTVSHFLRSAVQETGHTAAISIGAGVTSGLSISSAGGGAAAVLTLTSGSNMTFTTGGTLNIVGMTTVAAGTGKNFVCIDNATKRLYEGTGASCN